MSQSLIRKNQLHPDIADLISGYGDNFFLTLSEFNNAIQLLEQGLIDQSVLITGNQTINGNKNFLIRPTVNGTGVLLQGEASTGGGGTVENAVYTTGNQTIGGIKTFTLRPTLNGIGLATTGEVGGASTAFNGVRPITLQVAGFQNLQPNGDNVVTFLNNLFYPFAQASVTLNSFPLQELGSTITFIDFEGSIPPGSLTFGTDINNVTAFSNGVSRLPLIPTPNSNNTTFDQGINLGGSISSNVNNCFVRINTKNQAGNVITLDSSPQTIFFEAPMYAGSGSVNLMTLNFGNPGINVRNILSGQGITNPGTNNGKSLISKPASRTVSVTTNGYYYFVYPTGWGLLSRIEDTNFNLNFISDFTSGTIILPLINETLQTYIWYRNINQITLSDYGVRYIF